MSAACFVTGGGGFVGRHLLDHLKAGGERPLAPDRAELDLLDEDATRNAIRVAQPGVVFHLAAVASVARSWEAPKETLLQNVAMTVNVLEAIRLEAPEASSCS